MEKQQQQQKCRIRGQKLATKIIGELNRNPKPSLPRNPGNRRKDTRLLSTRRVRFELFYFYIYGKGDVRKQMDLETSSNHHLRFLP